MCPGTPNLGCAEHHRAALELWLMQGRHYLRRAYESGQLMPRLFIHPWYWLQGPPIQRTNWQARYSNEEPYIYSAPTPVESNGEILTTLRE
jgi:hypothetical protein